MNIKIAKLMEVKRSLGQSQKLSDLWQDSSLLWQEMGWQKSQLRLWLAVLPGIEINHGDSQDPHYQLMDDHQEGESLSDVIYNIISKVGRPMPIAQLKSQLSPELAATEPMIKAAVKEHNKLSTMGPVVKIR